MKRIVLASVAWAAGLQYLTDVVVDGHSGSRSDDSRAAGSEY